jgi:hypothetical protein
MAHAGLITFLASGIFQDGSTLGGTILIDTTAGSVISGDLTITGHVADFTTFDFQRTWPLASPFLYETSFENGQLTGNNLIFLFPPVSLVGYSGGILCGITTTCLDAANMQYYSNFNTRSGGSSTDFVELDHGSLVAAPEPSTAAMCLIVLFLVVLETGRRLRSREDLHSYRNAVTGATFIARRAGK